MFIISTLMGCSEFRIRFCSLFRDARQGMLTAVPEDIDGDIIEGYEGNNFMDLVGEKKVIVLWLGLELEKRPWEN